MTALLAMEKVVAFTTINTLMPMITGGRTVHMRPAAIARAQARRRMVAILPRPACKGVFLGRH
jgi:hypothetical protein